MILFLNFAPLTFGGGMERWILSVASGFAKGEKVMSLTVDKSISNIYAKFILSQNFDERMPVSKELKQKFITWESLIPFSPRWREINKFIKEARLIYTKLEVNEVLLLIYFGGFKILKKTVIGLHSPFIYTGKNLTFLQSFHNAVYSSFYCRFILHYVKKVHLLTQEQFNFVTNVFKLKNAVLIPNYFENEAEVQFNNDKKILKVCFAGELNYRKGTDILVEIVQKSPKNFHFTIAGDGPMKDKISSLKFNNVDYGGYVNQEVLQEIIGKSDVLLAPSRAEGFSMVMLNALSQGLEVVTSKDISTNNLNEYLTINKSGSVEEYVNLLNLIYDKKQNGMLKDKRINTSNQIRSLYSKKIIFNKLKENIFN